jgi:hypothetical protein
MQLGFAKSGDPQLKGVARNIGNGTYSKNQSQSALESEAPGTPGARNANGLTFTDARQTCLKVGEHHLRKSEVVAVDRRSR